MVSFANLRQLQPGGTNDALALLAGTASMLATNPANPLPWGMSIAVAGTLGLAAGAYWANRAWALMGATPLEPVGGLRINSSPPPPVTHDGVILGYIVDTGEPLVIPMRQWMRHAMIVGQSGVGKTVLGSWLMLQQIVRGGAVLWIDGKLDPDNLRMLREICAYAGREDDLLVINPGEPENSNTYNPILFGDPDEVASRCISLIPSTESNAGADYYRQEANQAVTTLINTIQACGLAYSFADISTLMNSAEALTWLESRVPQGSDAQKQYSLFLHKFKTPQKDGRSVIDVKKLKDQLGGIAGRMFTFGTGKFGQVLNSYDPEVRLKEDLLAGKIIYVMLPTMGKAEAASNFGKMVVGDFRSAIAQIQALPEHERPDPPVLSFFDECGSYVTNAWSRIFEQARSARLMMVPAFQTKANLEVLGDELLRMVIGNTLTKVFFKPGENETAELMAELIGKEWLTTYSISASQGTGSAKASHLSSRPSGWTDSGAVGFSESQKLEYRITASELMQLGQGECIVQYDGDKIYHIRVPMFRFSDEIRRAADMATINHKRYRRVRGVEIANNVNRWIGRGDGT